MAKYKMEISFVPDGASEARLYVRKFPFKYQLVDVLCGNFQSQYELEDSIRKKHLERLKRFQMCGCGDESNEKKIIEFENSKYKREYIKDQ